MRLLRRLGNESGLSMIIMLSVLTVTSMIIVAAYTSGTGEVRLTALDVAGKRAYYAAQAGISEYASHLAQDSNYLAFCTKPTPANPALDQLSEGTTHKVAVPGTTNEEYAIDLIPAETAPAKEKYCNVNNVSGTMIEGSGKAAGTFRIESTGFSEHQRRRIVATFRNANFVSYVWYDVYETGDPSLYGEADEHEPSKFALCGQYWGLRPSYCNPFNNYFISGESVRGPMHTEDHVGISGNPSFGRSISDRIEFGHSVGGDSGYSCEEACGSAEPKFVGTHVPPSEVPSIKPPPGDEELEHIVEAAYHFTDKTKITLEGETDDRRRARRRSERENGPQLAVPRKRGHLRVGRLLEGLFAVRAETRLRRRHGLWKRLREGGIHQGADDRLAERRGHQRQHPDAAQRRRLPDHERHAGPDREQLHPPLPPGQRQTPECFLQLQRRDRHRRSPRKTRPSTRRCWPSNTPSSSTTSTAAGRLGDDQLLRRGRLQLLERNDRRLLWYDALTGYGYNAEYDYRLQAQEPPHFLNPIQAAWYIQRETIAPCTEGCG